MKNPGFFPKSILAIRADRLGDVLLTTPSLQALKRSYPEARLTVMVQPWIAPLIRGLPFVDSVLEYEPHGRFSGMGGFWNLVSEFKRGQFDWVICFQTKPALAMASFLARTAVRVGPLSKPHSWLFFNYGLRQHRSEVAKHEAEYNLDLLSPLGVDIGMEGLRTHAHLSDQVRAQGLTWLKEKDLEPGRFVVVHPGMGGSALNWPKENYAELVAELTASKVPVLVSGNHTERELIEIVVGESGAESYVADGQGIDFLGAIFAQAKVVVAPSTGPLHLAVALGRRVVSFYPPIRVQSAKRWGPWFGIMKARATVFTPESAHVCEDQFACREQRCQSHPCMRSLKNSEVLKAVMKHFESVTP